MRIIPGLALSWTLIVLTNAGFVDLDVVVPKTDPDPVVPDPPPKEYPPSPPIDDPPPAQAPGEQPGENESESNIGEALSDILDAITSIISLAGGTSTTITSTIGLPCVTKPSGPKTAVASMQSSCLCPPATGLFDDYLGSCSAYVQAQTQLATRSGIVIVAAFNPSATTTAAVASTIALATGSETTAPQAVSTSTGAASVPAPMIMSRGSWYPVWWAVIVLVGCGWAGYSRWDRILMN